MKTGEIAKRLGVSPSTIRLWTKEHEAHFSKKAKVKGTGARRNFIDHDVRVLTTIADLRSNGLTAEQIEEVLTAGKLAEDIPELPSKEEEEAQRSVALVPLAELQRAMDTIRVKQDEVNRLVEERDNALIDREEANKQIAELNRELGRAKGVVFGAAGMVILLIVVAIALAVWVVRLSP